MDVGSEQETRSLVLRRFRCVAFAALGAGITEAELLEALRVAVAADTRRNEPASATPPRQRHLRAVPTVG